MIIPKDLRIPLLRVSPPKDFPQKRSNLKSWVILGSIAMVICGAVVIFSERSSQSTAEFPITTSSFDSSSVTTPTISTADSATATVEARATTDALQPILKLEQNWPASFTEPFTDNSHQWLSGDVRDDYISGNRSISAGTYTWKITSVKSASDFSFPNTPDLKDFYASVEMNLVSMPDDPDADAGMVFRYNSSDQSWYYFSVSDKGQYYFGWYNGSDWSTLIPETASSAIQVGETNKLTVGAKGTQFIFLINGKMVDHFIDDNLKSGNIGVGINLPKAGEKTTVEFSKFSVLSPSPNP